MHAARFLVPLCFYTALASGQELSCTALVSEGNDLYLSSDDGSPSIRLTDDGKAKYGAALSPRADKASFFYEKPDMKMQVVTRGGDTRTFVLTEDAYQIATRPDATQWDSEALVLVQFYGHANSMFEWVGVGKTRVPSNVPKGATDPEFRGDAGCASTPQARHIACAGSNWISIDDRTSISIDPFDDGRKLGKFDVLERVTTQLPGYDGASFTVTYVKRDGTSIRGGFGEFQPEMFLPDNEFGLVERIGDSAWGEFRVTSHHEGSGADAGRATVAVRVVDVEDLPELSGALAWTDDGSTLAAVYMRPGSASEIVLVQRKHNGAGPWRISKTFPISEDAGRIKFIDASTLYVQGSGTESAVFAIRQERLERVKSLSNYFKGPEMDDRTAHRVEDWSCVRH